MRNGKSGAWFILDLGKDDMLENPNTKVGWFDQVQPYEGSAITQGLHHITLLTLDELATLHHCPFPLLACKTIPIYLGFTVQVQLVKHTPFYLKNGWASWWIFLE